MKRINDYLNTHIYICGTTMNISLKCFHHISNFLLRLGCIFSLLHCKSFDHKKFWAFTQALSKVVNGFCMLTAIQIPSKKIIKNYSFVTVNKSIGYGTFPLHSLKKTMPLLYTHNGKILKNVNVLLLISHRWKSSFFCDLAANFFSRKL